MNNVSKKEKKVASLKPSSYEQNDKSALVLTPEELLEQKKEARRAMFRASQQKRRDKLKTMGKEPITLVVKKETSLLLKQIQERGSFLTLGDALDSILDVDHVLVTEKTFMGAVREGSANINDIDAWVDKWHSSLGSGNGRESKKLFFSLPAYLGLSLKQYTEWLKDPRILSSFV